MKDKTKGILIAVLMVLAIGSMIMLVDSPKPSKLGANISREINKVAE